MSYKARLGRSLPSGSSGALGTIAFSQGPGRDARQKGRHLDEKCEPGAFWLARLRRTRKIKKAKQSKSNQGKKKVSKECEENSYI